MSLSRRIALTLGHNLFVALVLATAVMGGLATQDRDATARPVVVESAAGLLETHGCTNPDDPTHAVVTVDGVTRYVGQRMTDRAIEQAMFGVDHGLTVHGFCS